MTSYPLLDKTESEPPHREEEEGFVTKNTIKMPFSNNAHSWFVWDPCGIVCAVITYLLIVYGELVVLMVLAPPFPTVGTGINVVIFTTLAFLAVVSHVKAMCTNPVSRSMYCSVSVSGWSSSFVLTTLLCVYSQQ